MKLYTRPEIEVSKFDTCNVVTTSEAGSDSYGLKNGSDGVAGNENLSINQANLYQTTYGSLDQ